MFNLDTHFPHHLARLLAAGLVAVAAHASVQAADMAPAGASHGAPVADDAANRTVTITPSTKWVNVNDGDTVTFVEGDQHFTWHFATLRGPEKIKLSAIAPQNAGADNVVIYVGRNPLYKN